MRLLRSVSPAAGFTAASIGAQRHAHVRPGVQQAAPAAEPALAH
jgi:hypothetical protein